MGRSRVKCYKDYRNDTVSTRVPSPAHGLVPDRDVVHGGGTPRRTLCLGFRSDKRKHRVDPIFRLPPMNGKTPSQNSRDLTRVTVTDERDPRPSAPPNRPRSPRRLSPRRWYVVTPRERETVRDPCISRTGLDWKQELYRYPPQYGVVRGLVPSTLTVFRQGTARSETRKRLSLSVYKSRDPPSMILTRTTSHPGIGTPGRTPTVLKVTLS